MAGYHKHIPYAVKKPVPLDFKRLFKKHDLKGVNLFEVSGGWVFTLPLCDNEEAHRLAMVVDIGLKTLGVKADIQPTLSNLNAYGGQGKTQRSAVMVKIN